MVERKPTGKLAYEIGLCRIALVVDAVHGRMSVNPKFEELFVSGRSEGEKRARLTYFWWVVLGGNKLSVLEFEVIAEIASTGIRLDLLREWLAMFRETAEPIIGEKLTSAWLQRAEQLAFKYLITDDEAAVSLAKAC